MTAYMVVMLDITDTRWIAEYRRNVPPLLEKAGGRYLAFSTSPRRIEGDGPVPETLVIIAFPSQDAAQAFLTSPEYQPYAEARQAGARTTIYLVDDDPAPAA